MADALAAGNGVVWKPSELASLVGLRLQRSLDAAHFPEGLVATVFGGPDVGRALTEAPIAKGHFTGGIVAGRRVLTTLAERGIPATVELSGFDPAIVLPDAPLPSTVRALSWAAFVVAGQTCAAVKRVYIVGDATPWAGALAQQADSLRVGDPALADIDVGPLITETARDRFDAFIKAAVGAGARVLAGGERLPGPGWFYKPTVLLADPNSAAPEQALAGCFGPVVLVRGVSDANAAVNAANASPFGLTASVWGRNRREARALAARIEAGLVAVNDAVAPLGHAAAPFGGTKASGFGRSHGALGLREFAQPQVLHDRAPGGWRPQVFPYNARIMLRGLAFYRKLFHSPG
jgi:acyl-CoA reductase-like NAD-dependent aldehyde dehydrogenase